MIYTNLKQWTKEFFINIKSNNRIVFGTMAVLCGLILIHLRSGVFTNNVKCVADAFIFVEVNWFFGIEIVIVINFLLLEIVKFDYNIKVVIRQKSRVLLWLKQIYKACLLSIFSSIWIIICTYLFGGLMCKYYINWTSTNSIYYKVNRVVCQFMDFGDVILIFLLCSIIRIILVSTISLLIYWITNKKIVSWIVVVALGFFEITVPIIYKIISINYEVITTSGRLIGGFLYGIISIFIVISVGIILGKRREFYNGQ